MIPEHRLAVLLDQVKDHWVSKCLYHNTSESPSLYLDHQCDREEFPLRSVLELRHHVDEVWFLKFSNNGSMLATTGKDQRIYVYDTANYTRRFVLEGHENGVCYLAWSPDDAKLISCSQDNSAKLWDMTVRKARNPLRFTSCSDKILRPAHFFTALTSASTIL